MDTPTLALRTEEEFRPVGIIGRIAEAESGSGPTSGTSGLTRGRPERFSRLRLLSRPVGHNLGSAISAPSARAAYPC